jgi:cation diffusion facilitator CzcD-associated flavoprotein CzcO
MLTPALLSQPHLHCCPADKYKLWNHIQLNTRVCGATYDEDRAVWCVSTTAGQQKEVQVLVLAQGALGT